MTYTKKGSRIICISYLQYADIVVICIVRDQNGTAGYKSHRLFIRVIRNSDELSQMRARACTDTRTVELLNDAFTGDVKRDIHCIV